jgi:hypothetical protein
LRLCGIDKKEERYKDKFNVQRNEKTFQREWNSLLRKKGYIL